MKTILNSIIFLLSISSASGQSHFTNKKGDKHLWGTAEMTAFNSDPFKTWFDKNYNEYNSDLTSKEGKLFKDVSVKVFIGTWCGDTKLLFPQFVKAWEQMGLDKNKLEIIALHVEGDKYKQGPNQETVNYNIHKVPTFIFEKDGKEMGRIVERTVFNLDTDLIQIATQQAYECRYQGVELFNNYLSTITHKDSLNSKRCLNEAYKLIRREISTSSELNAYAYVLKAQKKYQEAELAFKVNRYMFPYNPNVRDSYGEILFELKKYDQALEQYYEVIRLKTKDENAVVKISEILNKMKESD